MNIDINTYNKVKLYPPGKQNPPKTYDQFHRGYAFNRGNPRSIIIHTTNGQKGTTFEAEANFIYRSQNISAHFLIGKKGQISQFLDPTIAAYHAGSVFPKYRYFGNPYSIGIEIHYAIGERFPDEQRDALFELCRYLVKKYNIESIETHREVASPKGRKVDPSCFTDPEFYSFINKVLKKNDPLYTIIADGTRIRSKPDTKSTILNKLSKGDTIKVSAIIKGEPYQGNDQWYQLKDQSGYIWSGLVKISDG